MENYQEVFLIRNNKIPLKVCLLPNNFFFRTYQKGDEKNWFKLFSKTNLTNNVNISIFNEYFYSDEDLLKERQFYIIEKVPNQKIVGTATAWFNNNFHGEKVGRLHWLSIDPNYQKKQLGTALVYHCCKQLIKHNYKKTYLRTYSFRIQAIDLYLKFDFSPFIRLESDLEIWNKIQLRIQNKKLKTFLKDFNKNSSFTSYK